MKRSVVRDPWSVIRGLWVLCVLFTVHGSRFTVLASDAETGNRIVAIVNEDVVTEGDVASHMSALFEDNDPPPKDVEAGELRQAVLKRLIEERLIVQEAKRLGLTVTSEEVGERLQAIQQRLQTKEAYEDMLRETQLTEEQLKTKIREQLLVQQVINQEVRSKIVVTPSEIARASTSSGQSLHPGEEVLAYHLLIRVTEQRSAKEAQQLTQQLYEQLLKGADFETLARAHSEDPNAADGGRLGWVRQWQLLPELDEALFQLGAGEVSGPIQTRLGFHLVKAGERRSRSGAEVTEASLAMQQQLYQAKIASAISRWIEELKQRAYIEIIDE